MKMSDRSIRELMSILKLRIKTAATCEESDLWDCLQELIDARQTIKALKEEIKTQTTQTVKTGSNCECADCKG